MCGRLNALYFTLNFIPPQSEKMIPAPYLALGTIQNKLVVDYGNSVEKYNSSMTSDLFLCLMGSMVQLSTQNWRD